MLFRVAFVVASLAVQPLGTDADAQASTSTLTLREALSRALATNPRLTAAQRDIGIAEGRRIQSGAIVNPELSVEVDSVGGSGRYAGSRAAETTLQLSQQSLGTSVMGGMISVVVLALLMVPVFFVVVQRLFSRAADAEPAAQAEGGATNADAPATIAPPHSA